MKSKRIKIILVFIIVIAFISLISFTGFLVNKGNYMHHGPLAYPKEEYSRSVSPELKLNQSFLFGSLEMVNNTEQPITIMSVKPTNIPKGIDVKVQGMTTDGIGSMYYSELGKPGTDFTIKPFPIKIPSKSKDAYRAILNITPKKSGKFTVQGILVTYKWDNRLYQEYYRDQFTVYCNISKPSHISGKLPPEKWPE